MKQQIQIFGQRGSGTNYLEQLLLANFKNIEIVNYYAFKHIWNANLQKTVQNDDNIKIIIIVRNPYNWLRSVHRQPHHCPQLVGLPFDKFVRARWIAYSKVAWNSANPNIRLKNLHKAPKVEEFENAIIMRNQKNQLFLQIAKEHPDKVCLINYESLESDFNSALSKIEAIHDLSKINNHFIQISTYKNTGERYVPKDMIKIKYSTKKYIDELLHFDQEGVLGYQREDYKYSTAFDRQYYRFRLKQFLIRNKIYAENLDLTEKEIETEDKKKWIHQIKLKYRKFNDSENELKMIALNEILEIDADHVWAHLEKSILAKNQKAYEEALSWLDSILKKEPNNAKALFQKGVILKRMGNLMASLEYHEKVESIRPNWKLNLKKLIAIYSSIGQFEKSEILKRKFSNL